MNVRILIMLAVLSPALSLATFAFADEPAVVFDVPAICPAVALVVEGAGYDSNQKVIELVIPVSTRVPNSKRDTVEAFRIDVFWNRNVYPLVDYGPKTLTGSKIEGLVSIEKKDDVSGTIGLNLSSQLNDLVAGTVQANVQNKNDTTVRYSEIPQHEVFVASGTIQRGTGAFFRFHPSASTTLEGGRDLVVAYQVPQDWRGGIVQIDCFSKGKRRIFAGWTEPVEVTRSFVIPVYLQGDEEARIVATEFVRSEQQFRNTWKSELRSGRSSSRLAQVDLSALIQSSSNSELKSLQRSMSPTVRESADRFLGAKRELTMLSR